MKKIRELCACGQPIEAPGEMAGAVMDCPACGQEVKLMSETSYTDYMAREVSRELRRRAAAVEKVSWFLFGVFGLCLVIAVWVWREDGSAGGVLIAGGFFFVLAYFTNLIAQLIHIRAALLTIANKK